jgi:hypothetical protein
MLRKPDPSFPPPPESYVVRIYRRDARLPARVAGTVEAVGSGSEHSFRNLRELQLILAGKPPTGR